MKEAIEWMNFQLLVNEVNGYYMPSKRYLKSTFIARIGFSIAEGQTSYEQALRLGRQYLYSAK